MWECDCDNSESQPLFFAGFFWGSFAIAFNSIFQLRNASDPENSRAQYTYRLYQVVELLFFLAIVFGIEKLIIRFIGLRFHAVAYADRLRENMFALSTIDKLKDHRPKKRRPPVVVPHSYGVNGGRSGATTPLGWRSPLMSVTPTPTMPSAAVFDGFRPSHFLPSRSSMSASASSPADPRVRSPLTPASQNPAGDSRPGTPGLPQTPGFAESVTSGSSKSKKKLATAQEIARQAMIDPLKTLQNPLLAKKGLGLDFSSPADGKRLARDLFHAFRQNHARSYLVTSDFYPAFPTTEDAEAAFRVFDKDGNGDISRSEIKHTILAAYKERRFLARSLQDVSSAISTLDKVFMAAAFVVGCFSIACFVKLTHVRNRSWP